MGNQEVTPTPLIDVINTDDRPSLSCPKCGAVGLIPAHGRGRTDRDGNDIAHTDACRCRWCSWWWWEDRDPVRCQCGVLVGVEIDDGAGHAYSMEVEMVPAEEKTP